MDIFNTIRKAIQLGKTAFSASILLVFALFSFKNTLLAQYVPQGFNYQCVVRDGSGAVMNNQTVTLLFAIKSGAPNGPVAYAETQLLSTNEFGLINTVIGEGTVVQGAFNSINWGGGTKYVTVSIESNPGVFDELGTSEFQSVPYALYALNVANGGSTGGDNWGNQSVQSDATLSGNGTQTNPLKLASQNAQIGQVLKWDGTKWIPQDDISDTGTAGGTVTQINTGNGLSGGPITTNGTIALSPTGVIPGAYGSATEIPVITIDANGRITNVWKAVPSPGTVGIIGAAGIGVQQNGTSFTITNTGDTNPNDDVNISDQAGGDLSGPFGNLQLQTNSVTTLEIENRTIRGLDINQMDAVPGEVLKWNGTVWLPEPDETGITAITLDAGNGISINGNTDDFTITNTGDTDPTDDLTQSDLAGGDLSGMFDDLQIRPNAVGAAEIQNGSVDTDELSNSAVTTAKLANIAVSTSKIQNQAVSTEKIEDQAITAAKIQDGAVTEEKIDDNAVSSAKIQDSAITANKLDDMGAATGEVLKWSGTAWEAAADLTGGTGGGNTYSAGAGIAVTGTAPDFEISNTGDLDASDDLTIDSEADGDVTGLFDNLQIANGAVTTIEIENGTIRTVDLSTGAVTTDKIADAAVTAEKLDDMGAATGEVLKWNGTAWEAAADLTGGTGGQNNYTAGTGISITGTAPDFEIENTGDTDPSDDLTTSTVFSGDVSGTFDALVLGNNTVSSQNIVNNSVNTSDLRDGAVTAEKLDDMGAQNGQVLKWNGTIWEAANDNAGGSGSNWRVVGNDITPIHTGSVFIGQAASNSGKLQVSANNQEAAVFKINSTVAPNSALVAETSGPGIAGFFTSGSGPALVTGNGSVGVGVAAPKAKVHVRTTNDLNLLLEGDQPRIGFKAGTSLNQNPIAFLTKSGKNFSLKTQADSVNILLEPNGLPSLFASGLTGSVGIGAMNNTDHPLRVFHNDVGMGLTNLNTNRTWEFFVDDSGNLLLFNDILGSGMAAGTFTSTGTYTPSDKRLKDDIRPLLGVLEKIQDLSAVSYRFKGNGAQSIGLIAQDVQAVFPELVTQTAARNGQEGHLAVNYGALSAIALQAVREQQGEIEVLKKENEALKQRMERIEQRLGALEKE